MTKSVEQQPEYSPDLLYKFLEENGKSPFARSFWKLPSGEEPGGWMKSVPSLIVCRRGYHLCREQDLRFWASYPMLYVAEGRGAELEADDKVVYESARLLYCLETWSRRNRSLWAADCAEHVLSVFEESRPDDLRPRRAIESVRAYWSGTARKEDLWAAARNASDAAGAGCRYALYDPSRDYIADAANAASEAASLATTDALYAVDTAISAASASVAYASSDFAARFEAKQREQEWQLERLLDYLWPEREEKG